MEVTFCHKCGAKNETAAQVCPSCGANIISNSITTGAGAVTLLDDSFGSVRFIAPDPAGRIKQAFEKLGDKRALQAGAIFALFHAITCVIISMVIMHIVDGIPFLQLMRIKISQLTIVMSVFVPFLTILGGLALCRVTLHSKGSFGSDLFVCGLAWFPVDIVLLILFLTMPGADSWSVRVIISFAIYSVLLNYAFCAFVLTIFSSFREINGLDGKKAMLGITAALTLSGFLNGLIYKVLF